MSAENVKWRVNMAVRNSNLPAPARLIMFVLSDRADAKTGIIPEKHSPSLTDLVHDTDLGESTIKTQLTNLERLGWVTRARPDKKLQGRYASTQYRLQVGDPGEVRIPHKRARSKPSQNPEEGQDVSLSEGQEQALSEGQEGQEQAPRGPGDSSKRARRWPPYIKDDDHNDLDDLSATADAATNEVRDALFEAPPAPKRPESTKQRAYRLASAYTGQVRLSSKDAVAGVVHKAVLSTGLDGKPYTDEQIISALQQLITERRSVTADSLRIALDGPPLPGQRTPTKHETYRDSAPSTFRPPK